MKPSLVLVLILVTLCHAEVKQFLRTYDLYIHWTVANSNGSINVPGSVPGGIYTDLRSAGVLKEDIFYRFNDINYSWVGGDNWTYSTTFSPTEDVLNNSNINLVFLGLDTIGSVYLNDKLVGTFDNMFVRYVFPVQNKIKAGQNLLNVSFTSPIDAALRRHEVQAESYKIPPLCSADGQNGLCHINYLRKMQASFSWDWGPAFPSVGLWKPAYIEGYNENVIRDVTIHVQHNSTAGVWSFTVQVYGDSSGTHGMMEYYVEYNVINGNGGQFAKQTSPLNPTQGENILLTEQTFIISEEEVQLWWPNGYGNQTLSRITVTYYSTSSNEISTKSINFGFRTIRLVQDQIVPNLNGTSFYFEVNHVPIFAKGSNWIPGHVLPELGYEESRLRHLLTSAKEVHQNMIRVWGGGVYESDLFYQLADELGIMIWQDFMFAVALYPTNEEFINSVKVEVEQQVKRLQHHASIAVWAGNNENEAGLGGGWWALALLNYTVYYNDYVKLYVDTIRPIVTQLDKSRSYVTSSPSNGIETEMEGYVAKNPYSPLYGDTHYYNYINDGWNSNNYPNTRFASEYGFQSLPSFQTMAEVSIPEDWHLNSSFSLSRQHHAFGYTEMTYLLEKHLPLPEDDGSVEHYQTYIYYSQISQAMSIKTETEKYRTSRNVSIKTDNGLIGQTMGALYWQLNDVWQAPTWASIDFKGNWKMLHYFAKRFFSPILASLRLTMDGKLLLYVTSDLLEKRNIIVTMSVYRYDSFTSLYSISQNISVIPASSFIYQEHILDLVLNSSHCPSPVRKSCFVYINVVDPTDSETYPDNFLFPSSLTDAVGLSKPNVEISCNHLGSGQIELQIQLDRITPFVWIESEIQGTFSDNGMLIVDERGTSVTFTAKDTNNFSCTNMTGVSVRTLQGIAK